MSDALTASPFGSTSWSLVRLAGDNPEHLERLLRIYWGPIYAFVRRSGCSRDEATELTQEFILQVVLERNLISKVDEGRGRFRSFLKAAIRNFLVDRHRRSTAKGRSPAQGQFSTEALDSFEPDERDDPSRAFERQWATTVLSRTLERLESDCMKCGQARHWSVFRLAVIEPALGLLGGQSPGPRPLSDIAREVGAEGPEQVSSMIQTIRRKFRRLLADVVGETLEDPADAPDEVARIQEWLEP